MKQVFEEKNLGAPALALVAVMNDILDEYAAQGYDLSLRQLYYQLVARAVVENTERSYKRVGTILSDARLAGLVDWDMIRDRGRVTVIQPHWGSPGEIVRACAAQYSVDKWRDQPTHVEVMVEKQALEGVLLPVCKRLDVPFTANKGYSSSSALYEAGMRLAKAASLDKEIHIIYLGDHDPSGIDMTRDVGERLELFSEYEVCVHRVALNMDQIQFYAPPENPAKTTDSRAADYISKFGTSSWELDALAPNVLALLVETKVKELRDDDLWEEAVEKETRGRAALVEVADSMDDDDDDLDDDDEENED